MTRRCLSLALTLTLALSGGCGKSKKPEAAHTPAEPVKWETFKAHDESFSASLPGPAIVQMIQNDEGKQILCGLNQSDGVTYSIIMNQVNHPESGPSVPARLKALVDAAPLSYGASAKMDKTDLNVKVDGNPAAEYSLSFTRDGKSLKLRCRVFFAHDQRQLFQLIAAGPEGAPEAEKFFSDFKVGKYSDGKSGKDGKAVVSQD